MRLMPVIVGWITGLCAAAFAHAQTLESLEWVDGATPPTARLRFNASVRLLRQAPTTATTADLWQLGIQIAGSEGSGSVLPPQESRRLAGDATHPALEVYYIPLNSVATRLVSVRADKKSTLLARPGPGGNTLDLLLTHPDAPNDSPMPSMASAVEDRHYAVVLERMQRDGTTTPRIPSQFQDYAVVALDSTATGLDGPALALGYFKTADDAAVVRQRALLTFPQARVLALKPPTTPPAPNTAPSAEVKAADPPPPPRTPAATPPPEAPTSLPLRTTQAGGDVAAQAAALLTSATAALASRDYRSATESLNRALLLPPNPSSEQAQRLIGEAWEGAGEFSKARAEYALFLKLYPDHPATRDIAARLAVLESKGSTGTAPSSQEAKPRVHTTGSISQFYYGGNTKTDSLVNIAAGIDQSTLSRTSQSVLVSSWDATARYAGEDSETKLVMRGARSDNLASTSTTTSSTQGLISAAYLDYRDLKTRTDIRLGRQSAIGGAMFGLFDGVSMATPVGPGYKLDAMLGVPANQLVSAPQQAMAGVMLEADNMADRWGGNVSLMEQTTEGISDRRALGLELRYFGEAVSVFSQIDYEVNLQSVNAITLQASVQGTNDNTFTFMFDDRRAPALQLSNALISSGQTSLATLLQLKSLNEVQRMSLDTAAQARQAMVGWSRPFTPQWQGSIDLRYSEIGALPAVGNFQAQPATGAQYTVSAQLTGSNLYSSRDINGFNLSYLTSDSLQGTQIAYNNLTGIWGNQASLEPSLRIYTQTDNTATRVLRYSTGLRLSYKLSARANLVGEGIYEHWQTDGTSNHETSESMYFYVGYRYDFQ